MKTQTLITDDFSSIENQVRKGNVKSIGIDYLKSILNWKFYFYAKIYEN